MHALLFFAWTILLIVQATLAQSSLQTHRTLGLAGIALATAMVFTAVTMTIGVGTWVFSALKFQADMGILLAFMFFLNMLGALFLLPALAAFLLKPHAQKQSAQKNP